MLTIKVGDEQFTLTDEEVKALETNMVSIYEWIKNAIFNKARVVTNQIILEKTNYNPKKLSVAEKGLIIKDLTLETAVARNARIEAEINE